ncbi:MAG: hypothetical protein HZLCBSQH_001601, partial [Candidatus Fervidibacterota bacterium]
MPPLTVLDGKVALITGAARGIGFAAAKRMGQEGASIVIADIDALSAEQAADRFQADGINALAIPCDVADAQLFERAIAHFGRVDILVNNAAIQKIEPLLAKTPETFDRVLAVNLRGPFLCIVAFAKHVQRRGGGGVIINVASALGIRPAPQYADYACAKAGLLALTKVAAQELAPLDIRVNALIPPATRTELNREFFAKPEVVNAIMERLLIKRIAEPDEIADAFVFLASDASRFM